MLFFVAGSEHHGFHLGRAILLVGLVTLALLFALFDR